MAFVIDERFLPATLTAPGLTDDEFVAFCAEHPDYFVESTADGELLVMPPASARTGAIHAHIVFELNLWNRREQRGKVIDASGGYFLRNGARRAPDIAWIANSHLAGLEDASELLIYHLCPNFIVEVRSPSDRLAVLRRKMREWVDNGVELAWLIDPQRRAVEIYRPAREHDVLEHITSVAGEGPVEGFLLDLAAVWHPFQS